MSPSDPDFPFDIKSLECGITVPINFPENVPLLRVRNAEMARGFQVNVEQGFSGIWRELSQKSLLNAIKLLDRRLEALLTVQKAETITIVTNTASVRDATRIRSPTRITQEESGSTPESSLTPAKPQEQKPTEARLEHARAKRDADIRQLKQRLGRDPLFKDEADGTLFTLPMQPRKANELPAELRTVKTVRLIVPEEYDLEPPSIELVDVSGEACNNIEQAFTQRAREHPSMTLLAHVNYLAQNMHAMAAQSVDPVDAELPAAETPPGSAQTPANLEPADPAHDIIQDPGKSHIKIIPRPPEWDEEYDDDEDEAEEDYDSDWSLLSSSGTTSGDADKPQPPSTQTIATAGPPRESGILLSFPNLELYNIELLELHTLSLSVKCTRCKEPADLTGIKPNTTSGTTTTTTPTPPISSS